MTTPYLTTGINFGKRATDYATYRAGFPLGFYERLQGYFGILQAPSKILDLGSGTGTIARSLAAQGHHVTALDISHEMLAECRRLEQQQQEQQKNRTPRHHSIHPITYCPGATAENTGIREDGTFDLVFAGQCWHWFDAPRALNEISRLLSAKPSSRLVIANFDWLVLPETLAGWTDDIIGQFNPKWTTLGKIGSNGTGFHPQWTFALHAAGFCQVETFSFVEDVPYSHDAWCGRLRACAGIGAGALSEQKVEEFETALRAELQKYPDPVRIPHRCFALICSPPSVRPMEKLPYPDTILESNP